jgi:hypothetical protein
MRLSGNILTTPADVITQIKLLPKSGINTLPEALVVILEGKPNEESVLVPLAFIASPLPAIEVTVATELIGSELQITELYWAITSKKGFNSKTTNKHLSQFIEIEMLLFLTCFFSVIENGKFDFFDLSNNCFITLGLLWFII